MPETFARADAEISLEVAEEPSPEPLEPSAAFRILILGDFSGRANRGVEQPKLGGRRPALVDRDNFDEVLATFRPALELPSGVPDGPRIPISFAELDDFHPDRVYARVELFQALRKAREELSDPATFSGAAAAVADPAGRPSRPPTVHLPLDGLLESAIDETETRAQGAAPQRVPDDWSRFLHDLVAPHLVPGAPPRQKELIAEVDAAIGRQMRAVLHHPDFQALEAAWRAVFFLVRELETGPQLKLCLLDLTKQELAAALAQETPGRSEIHRLVVEQSVGTPGGEPWALLAGNYTFEPAEADAQLLARLAALAHHAGAPFLAAASPRVLGCESLAETPDPDGWLPLKDEARRVWESVRALPEARHLGLTLPRFLLRLPYGKEGESAERFDFEEFPGTPRHEEYLWGNPAFACVCLLGQAFGQCGWDVRPGVVREISGLPAHVYREDGESRLKPCAEVLLTERAAERILDAGPMPLLSIRGSDAIRIGRFQSLAPGAPLAGRWL